MHFLNDGPRKHGSTNARVYMYVYVGACMLDWRRTSMSCQGVWKGGGGRVRRLEGSFPEPLSW